MATQMTVWGAGDEFSDSIALDVVEGVGQHGASVVSMWAGDEYDPAYLTPEAARKLAAELPVILYRLADAADPTGAPTGGRGLYFIARQVHPDEYHVNPCPRPSYRAAMADVVRELEARADPVVIHASGGVRHLAPLPPVVLVDLASLVGAEEMTEALLSDPMVRMIFDAGREAGREEVRRRDDTA